MDGPERPPYLVIHLADDDGEHCLPPKPDGFSDPTLGQVRAEAAAGGGLTDPWGRVHPVNLAPFYDLPDETLVRWGFVVPPA